MILIALYSFKFKCGSEQNWICFRITIYKYNILLYGKWRKRTDRHLHCIQKADKDVTFIVFVIHTYVCLIEFTIVFHLNGESVFVVVVVVVEKSGFYRVFLDSVFTICVPHIYTWVVTRERRKITIEDKWWWIIADDLHVYCFATLESNEQTIILHTTQQSEPFVFLWILLLDNRMCKALDPFSFQINLNWSRYL